jgi:hypothetical protein
VVDFYKTYEFFHVQYKHGLKILFRPLGEALPAETIAERKRNVSASLFALSNEALSKAVQRPTGQRALMLQVSPNAQPHLPELVAERDLLRIQVAGPPVDLDAIVAHSWTVSRLLRLAAANRLSLGQLDQHGQQTFELPGEAEQETLRVVLEPTHVIELSDVTNS